MLRCKDMAYYGQLVMFEAIKKNAAIKISLIYVTFSIAWIFFSDQILFSFVSDSETLTTMQSYKGWAFVIITAVIIYVLLNREMLKLQQLDNELQSLINNTPAVVYSKDKDGKFLYINRMYEDLSGTTKDKVIGKTDYDFFPKEIADKIRVADQQVLESGQSLSIEEVVPVNGKPTTYLSVKFPLFDNQKQVYAVCGISSDITDRLKTEESLRQSQKMEALGKLTGGIAHDFNNILGIMLGYAELMQASPTEKNRDDELHKYAAHIIQAGERAKHLTSKLLMFSRKKSVDPSKVDISQVLNHQSEILKTTLTPRIKLTITINDELWPVWVDKNQLEDSILNITINAMHAITETGTLDIHAQNIELTKREANNLNLSPGKYVRLEMVDNGIGMDNETRNRIFEPFFTTKDDTGTGLGMSQVYGFVKNSHGAISVDSQLGKGTSISIYLPKIISDSAPENKTINENYEEEEKYRGNERILIVDDEMLLGDLTKKTLLLKGYTATFISNTADALNLLKKEKFDLVLSDIIMPNMDGFTLVEKIKTLYPDIKIQLMSGYNEIFSNLQCDPDLLKSCLYKPFTTIELLKAIRLQLDQG